MSSRTVSLVVCLLAVLGCQSGGRNESSSQPAAEPVTQSEVSVPPEVAASSTNENVSGTGSVVGPERIALHAARILDPASGQVHSDAFLVIEGDRIVSVPPTTPPDDARRIELGDVTLLPGFIDCHTHLGSDLSDGWQSRNVTDTAADVALRGAYNAGLTLRAGFTSVRDVGSRGFADVALRKAIDAGFVAGPRMISAGHTISITGGHGDVTGLRPGVLEHGVEQGIADGVDEVVAAVRYQIKHGATVIKTTATSGVLSHEDTVGAQQYSDAELDAMVAEASRHGIKVAAHAHGNDGIKAAVRAGVASIEHGSVLDDEAIALMRERGCYLVPTTYLADAIDLDQLPPGIRAKAEGILPVAKDSVRRAIEAGVLIAYGTDAGVYPHGLNAREFAVLVTRGMSPLDALRSATVHAADLLGVDDRGRLAPGLLADLVAVPGNPLQDISVTETPSCVIKGGEFVLGSP